MIDTYMSALTEGLYVYQLSSELYQLSAGLDLPNRIFPT